MRRFFAFNSADRKPFFIAGTLLFLAIVAVAFLSLRGKKAPPSRELSTPVFALNVLGSHSLYFNGPARPWLLAGKPDLLTAEDKDEKSERSRAFAQAVQSPPLFRQLDRRYRFDTLLIVGDPSQSRPLLEHLMETRDWVLVYLDHTSLIFKRSPAPAWDPRQLQELRAKFAASKNEEATFLAQAAIKMLAMRLSQPAKEILDEAEKLDPKAIDVWSALAIYRTNRGEWALAMANADRALALDKDFLPALAAKTQIYYSTHRFDEALTLCTRLLAARPDDPGLLFYKAKIAHERHAYKDEVAVLQKLIALAEAESRPSSGYRIYLGQAHAAQSEAEPAIEQFSRALKDPDLPKEQREFAAELLAQIKKRSGL
ncbi:MAG: hypothetical protein JWL59_4576 [Chthoniobacteraceae bacterium]|nr:hypothetical protein [Chthoniobacteraceae bacterium]